MKDYNVKGKLVNLTEFGGAIPSLMNDKNKTNNVKTLELMTIINGLVNGGAPMEDISKEINDVVSLVKSAHNRNILKELVKALSKREYWDVLSKNL